MSLTRREFVKGSLATLGFLALPGTPLFAAPAGWKSTKKPNLVLGVMSDSHLRVGYDAVTPGRAFPLKYVHNAFKLFKSRNIDAFVHCGDAAHRGCVREWEFHKELLDEVFGKRGPDWVLPLEREEGKGKSPHPFSREGLLKVIGEPQFPPKAKLVVEKGIKGTKGTKGTNDGERPGVFRVAARQGRRGAVVFVARSGRARAASTTGGPPVAPLPSSLSSLPSLPFLSFRKIFFKFSHHNCGKYAIMCAEYEKPRNRLAS